MSADGPVWGASTDVGTRRASNEDSYVAAVPVFAVADGMGGHEAGEVASAAATRALARLAGMPEVTAQDVQERLEAARARLQALPPTLGRSPGTTVAGVVLTEHEGAPHWLVLNLGDSRTYRLQGHVLEQLSVDHSEVQELVAQGHISPEEALHHSRRHVLTRSLGAASSLAVDYLLVPVGHGDRMLVCSDGLTGELDDTVIAGLLRSYPHPQDAADALVAAAVAAGGRDNVTAVVVDAPRDLSA